VLVEPVTSILNRRHEGHAKTATTAKTLRGEYVFPAKRGGSKTPHLVEPKKAWATICRQAGLDNVRIHDLRRTLGSWQAMMGTSLQIIGRSLGHRSLQSTEVYARMDLDPVRASVTGAAVAMLHAANGHARTDKTDETPEGGEK
jgi:integrase